MVFELFANAVLVSGALFESQAVGLCNDWDDIGDLAQLLHDNDIDGLEGMAAWRDEVETAVDASVLNEPVAGSGEFFAQVCRVLILDVFYDGIPAVCST